MKSSLFVFCAGHLPPCLMISPDILTYFHHNKTYPVCNCYRLVHIGIGHFVFNMIMQVSIYFYIFYILDSWSLYFMNTELIIPHPDPGRSVPGDGAVWGAGKFQSLLLFYNHRIHFFFL